MRAMLLLATSATLACLVAACGLVSESGLELAASKADREPFEGPVPRATCGPDAYPETGMQGQVSQADRQSGENEKAHYCNLELISQYQGEGANWVSTWYEDCFYYGQNWPGWQGPPDEPGAVVLDVSDPAHPVRTATLDTTAMLDTHESLKANEKRALLAANFAMDPAGNGPLYFDVYDIKEDCKAPVLKATVPITNGMGHEGNWAPDGLTYYGSGTGGGNTSDPTQQGGIHAIDVTDPANPSLILNFSSTHGLGISFDGNRLYTSAMNILDVSDIQARKPNPTFRTVGAWPDGSCGQHTFEIAYGDQPYVVCVSEGAAIVSIVDIGDETAPELVSRLKLEIHMPENASTASSDTSGNGIFGMVSHYCWVDREHDPTVMGCGYFGSGIRIFDIRDPWLPKEIAYYNPPAQVGKISQLKGSEHANNSVSLALGGPAGVAGPPNMSTDWCSSWVRFIPERSEIQVTCQDNGFLALRFTNGVWPFK
jgi:hypothetical protein